MAVHAPSDGVPFAWAANAIIWGGEGVWFSNVDFDIIEACIRHHQFAVNSLADDFIPFKYSIISISGLITPGYPVAVRVSTTAPWHRL